MANFPASKIVRALTVLEGKDRVIFNDKTEFGRSIKVWGAGLEFYTKAVLALREAGYDVTLKKTRFNNLRLHIWEA